MSPNRIQQFAQNTTGGYQGKHEKEVPTFEGDHIKRPAGAAVSEGSGIAWTTTPTWRPANARSRSGRTTYVRGIRNGRPRARRRERGVREEKREETRQGHNTLRPLLLIFHKSHYSTQNSRYFLVLTSCVHSEAKIAKKRACGEEPSPSGGAIETASARPVHCSDPGHWLLGTGWSYTPRTVHCSDPGCWLLSTGRRKPRASRMENSLPDP